MDNERGGRLIMIACQTAAMLVAIAMLAGQYYAMVTTNPPPLPVTGGETAVRERLGFFEHLSLRRTVQERCDKLSGLEELTSAQQEQLEAIAELLGD